MKKLPDSSVKNLKLQTSRWQIEDLLPLDYQLNPQLGLVSRQWIRYLPNGTQKLNRFNPF